LGAVALTGALGSAAVAEPKPTNYEMASAAAHAACTELVQRVRPQIHGDVVAVRGVGANGGNFLVENALTRALTEAGLQVRTRPDSVLPILEVEIVDLAVVYVGSHRSKWVGPRWVEREARSRLFARLLDPSGARVLWADRAEASRRDEVNAGDLSRLEEEKPVAYTKPAAPAARWNKLVEPVVVTGIVVGLIVLFFSNQETN
jgi:hypothetical protein